MSRFEGWYFKHQKGDETLSIIVGRAADEAFIQVVTPEGAYRAGYPTDAYHRGETLRLADNRFSPAGIRLAIRDEAITLTGELAYGDLTPISGDIMGPFRFLPMQCRHAITSMRHGLTGAVTLNGRVIDFTGGTGYIEGDAGRSFPKSYTWVQCSAFPGDCSIMASAAHIPMMGGWFWGTIAVVWLDGTEHRLATYRGARIVQRDEAELHLTQRDLSLAVRFLQPGAGHLLAAPLRGRMTQRIREAPSTPAHFTFRRGGEILFEGESPHASCEHVP